MAFEDAKYTINNNAMWREIESINSTYRMFNFNSIIANADEIIKYEKNTSKDKISQSISSYLKYGDRSFNHKDFFIGKIYDEMERYAKIVEKYKDIYIKYAEYFEKVKKIFDGKRYYSDIKTAPQDNRNWFSKNFGTTTERRFYELQKYEEELFGKKTYRPQFPTLLLHLTATSMSQYGYKNYEKDITANFGEIIECYLLAIEKQGKMTFVQQQRAIVTDNMRYNVFKRDGFQCCLCGATARDETKLEVDHIVPVSKGGKSTMNNLQTLCERCNKGKRDKL